MEFENDDHFDFSAPVFRVPDPESPWFPQVNNFALTWNAYDRVGDTRKVSGICKRVDQAAENGQLGQVSIDDLRTTLFFYQRRTHHNDSAPPARSARGVA